MKLHSTKWGRISLALSTVLFLSIAVLNGCKEEEKKDDGTPTVKTITPTPFPTDLGIPGFNFPEDSTTIYSWLNARDTTSIYQHAWGIWAGLTNPTSEMANGRALLTYETWIGVNQLVNDVVSGTSDCTTKKVGAVMLREPAQFNHFTRQAVAEGQGINSKFTVHETVSYDPNAACHISKYSLFDKDTLSSYQVSGAIGKVPNFPAEAIALKPVYFVGADAENDLIKLPIWSVPDTVKSWSHSDWPTFVYVDVTNSQPADKVAVATGDTTEAAIEAATVNLSDVIHFALDKATADHLNQSELGSGKQYSEGDYALLVAMHVSTKEINNWTWQTFYWMPNPAEPLFPSSSYIASLRPTQLNGAASHYGMSVAYAFGWPNQPINGGTNEGLEPIFAFNPYLEGGFGTNTFSIPNALNPLFEYGMQTNCMSCHAFASQGAINAGYSTDQYISMDDLNYFKNGVQADFLWSIPDHAK